MVTTKRKLMQLGPALLLVGCAADQAQPVQGGSTSSVTAAQPPPGPDVPPQLAAFHGRWTGFWDSESSWSTVLNVTSVAPSGEVAGTYAFMQSTPFPFRSRIENGAFSFGRTTQFVFTMRPDGKLAGTRSAGSVTNTAVLSK